MQNYVTTTDAAKMLQVSRQYIWLLIALKKLPAEKIGGRYLINRDEIVKLFKKKIGGENA